MVTVARNRGYYDIDASRYGIERMDPAHYLRASYFERWLASMERDLIEGGYLTGADRYLPPPGLAPHVFDVFDWPEPATTAQGAEPLDWKALAAPLPPG